MSLYTVGAFAATMAALSVPLIPVVIYTVLTGEMLFAGASNVNADDADALTPAMSPHAESDAATQVVDATTDLTVDASPLNTNAATAAEVTAAVSIPEAQIVESDPATPSEQPTTVTDATAQVNAPEIEIHPATEEDAETIEIDPENPIVPQTIPGADEGTSTIASTPRSATETEASVAHGPLVRGRPGMPNQPEDGALEDGEVQQPTTAPTAAADETVRPHSAAPPSDSPAGDSEKTTDSAT